MIDLETPRRFRGLVAQAHEVAENVLRPISRRYDDGGHQRPVELDMLAAVIDGMNAAMEGPGASGVRRDMIGTAVTVVTGEELRARQIRQVADALRSLPGVSVNRSGAFGNITQVRIRGAEANQTLVLIKAVDLHSLPANLFTKAWLESKSR